MAKQKGINVVTHGLSGKIGDLLVFRQKGGKTVVGKVPKSSTKKSAKQKAHQKRFQQATIYGKMAIVNAETAEMYADAAKKKQNVTSYNIAVADFLNAPSIENVDLSTYTGLVGDKISIIASDDFAVKSVHIHISYSDGTLIEEGQAVSTVKDLWIYTATANNQELTGSKIVITVSDFPGNLAVEEMSL